MIVSVPPGQDHGEVGSEARSSSTMTDTSIPKITTLNWLNVAAFILNVVFTYGVGVLGWIGNGSNAQLSQKYQTLVTPNATGFSIWAVIFISQGIFTGVQLLPSFRQLPLVKSGISYNYISTCIFQALWTVCFSYEAITLSAFFMVAIWLSLLRLLYGQYFTMEGGSWIEFFLLRFPFALHCGWVTAATALSFNVILVNQNAGAPTQLAAGILSLAILHAISVWATFGLSNPNYTLSLVLAWATWWINVELKNPFDVIVDRFPVDAIIGVQYAAAGVTVVILLQTTIRYLMTILYELLPEDILAEGLVILGRPVDVTEVGTAGTTHTTASNSPPRTAFYS